MPVPISMSSHSRFTLASSCSSSPLAPAQTLRNIKQQAGFAYLNEGLFHEGFSLLAESEADPLDVLALFPELGVQPVASAATASGGSGVASGLPPPERRQSQATAVGLESLEKQLADREARRTALSELANYLDVIRAISSR